MLKVDDLKSQIQAALSNYLPVALEACLINAAGVESEATNKMAKAFRDSFDEMVSEPLAESLANAIDYYIKTASVYGTIITVGGQTTQTAVIGAAPSPAVGGKIPNTFGIM